MTGSVQHSTVAALRNNGKSKFCKTMRIYHIGISIVVFCGSQNCDGSSVLRGRGAVLDVSTQTGVALLQRITSDIYSSKSVEFLVRKSRFELTRLLSVLLTRAVVDVEQFHEQP